jgi:hypothetical protein
MALKRALLKTLNSWDRSDTVLIWSWALCVAGAVTAYEVIFNNDSGGFPSKFWADRVPFYFTMTLGFTAVTFGLSRVSPLKGWLGILLASAAASILFAAVVPGSDSVASWNRVMLGRNVLLLTTIYLVPPYLLATLIHWWPRGADGSVQTLT